MGDIDDYGRRRGWDARREELAGLPPALATILHRRGLHTRAAVAAWYPGETSGGTATRGIGPASLVAIAAWLGAHGEEGDDDAG